MDYQIIITGIIGIIAFSYLAIQIFKKFNNEKPNNSCGDCETINKKS